MSRPAEQPLPRWRRAMVVAGSQCPRAMLLALGFWVRYRGWENVEEGRREHAVGRTCTPTAYPLSSAWP